MESFHSGHREPLQAAAQPELAYKMKQLMAKLRSPITINIFTSAVTVLLVIRLFDLVNRYAINLLFWDQWDFFQPIFRSGSLWELFSWQHGPHRQGLGELLTYVIAWSSSWNSRLDSFAIVVVLLLSTLALLILKRILTGFWAYSDIIIPLALLNLGQYETLINTPNLSHSALPILLVILYALSWQIPNLPLKAISILSINFLAIFTGFGIFLGAITLLIYTLACIHALFRKDVQQLVFSIIMLVAAMLSVYIFFLGYRFQPAVECFSISWKVARQYPAFTGLMLVNFLHTGSPAIGIGKILVSYLLLAAALWVLVDGGIHLLRNDLLEQDKIKLVAFVLVGFSAIFGLNTAIGRICLGLEASQASRYITITSLSFCGFYLYLQSIKNLRWKTVTTGGMLAIMLIASVSPLKASDWIVINGFHDGKVRWKECYLKEEDIDKCNLQAIFAIYPVNDALIKQGLDFFKKHHLNLYLDLP